MLIRAGLLGIVADELEGNGTMDFAEHCHIEQQFDASVSFPSYHGKLPSLDEHS